MYEFALRLDQTVVKPPKKIKIEQMERALIKKAKYLKMPLPDAVSELRHIRNLESNPQGWEEARLAAAKTHPAVKWLEAMNFLYGLRVEKRDVKPDPANSNHLGVLGIALGDLTTQVFVITLNDKSTAAWFKMTWSEHFV
jgi:hypothetical protein